MGIHAKYDGFTGVVIIEASIQQSPLQDQSAECTDF